MIESYDDILNWIVYTGGICPDLSNGFGGDPTVKPILNLKIQQRPSELTECILFLLEKKEKRRFFKFLCRNWCLCRQNNKGYAEFFEFSRTSYY